MELETDRKRPAAAESTDLEEEGAEKHRKIDSDVKVHDYPPSRVLHARAVPDGSTQNDMIAVVQQFGNVRLDLLL